MTDDDDVTLIGLAVDRSSHIVEYDGDHAVYRYHAGNCPACGASGLWQSWCDVWTLNDDGTWQPEWSSWCFECGECCTWSVDPYGDGLIRIIENGCGDYIE